MAVSDHNNSKEKYDHVRDRYRCLGNEDIIRWDCGCLNKGPVLVESLGKGNDKRGQIATNSY
jgi:hypothetical protein